MAPSRPRLPDAADAHQATPATPEPSGRSRTTDSWDPPGHVTGRPVLDEARERVAIGNPDAPASATSHPGPAAARRPRCPTCRGEVVWADNPVRPFCSLRCKFIDLGSWLDEAYRMPGEPTSDDEAPRPAG